VIVATIAFVAMLIPFNVPENARSQYTCNPRVFALTTNVDIEDANGNHLYNVNGDYFAAIEDNLVMQDMCENIVREMDDEYDFITQNDHTILDGNGVLYSCQGNVNIIGNSYDVFNNKKEHVGDIEFNTWNTYGALKNMDGEIVAQYNSNLLCADYVVSIFENCEIDDASVLMMFASYYSDIRADN
jgi:uncharacterized protein YxjI